MSFSSKLSSQQALRLIRFAGDCGINFIDTADSYGQGDSEIVIGNAIHGNRDKFIVASKIGYRFPHAGRLHLAKRYFKPILRHFRQARSLVATIRQNAHVTNMIQQDFTPEYLEHAIDNSLRRLQTDYLDILYLHDVPLDIAQSSSVFHALDRVRRAGKVRYFGLSANDHAVLEYALKQSAVDVVQTAVHPGRPEPLWVALSKLAAAHIGVVANHVLDPDALESNSQENAKHRRLLEAGRRYGLNARQLLISFAVSQPSVSSVLIGTTSHEHLKENIADISSARGISIDELLDD